MSIKDSIRQRLQHSITAMLRQALQPQIASIAPRLALAARREALLHEVLTSTSLGVAPADKGQQIVVSLTTHGHRLHEAALAIESIMQGTMLPNDIVLWIDKDTPEPLPLTLQRQAARGLTIARTTDVGPHTKLIPALEHYPNADIITIDDDIFYPHDLVETLVNTHRQHPNAIIANTIMRMTRNDDGSLQTVAQWPYMAEADEAGTPQVERFFEGFGGVLYPAGCMPQQVTMYDTFRELCPTSDDIWFNAMARLAKRDIVLCQRAPFNFVAAVNEVCDDEALHHINNAESRNDKQLQATWKHWGLTL